MNEQSEHLTSLLKSYNANGIYTRQTYLRLSTNCITTFLCIVCQQYILPFPRTLCPSIYDAFVQRVFALRESNNHLIYIKRKLVKHRDQMQHIEEAVRRITTGIDKMETIEIAARNRDIHKCCIVCVISLILDVSVHMQSAVSCRLEPFPLPRG